MKTPFFLLLLPCLLQADTHTPDIPCLQKRNIFTDLYAHAKPIINEVKQSLLQLSAPVLYEWIADHPYAQTDAAVRFADYDELCKQERQFIKQRKARVKHALGKLFGKEVAWEQLPTIGICCSGGGFRAMVLTLGFLKGLEDIGLLDCSMYMTGLSGSTWAIGPWIASQKLLGDYIDELPYKTEHGLEAVKDPALLHDLTGQLLSRALYGQCLSMVDVTGPTIANTLLTDFGDDCLKVRLSESHAYIENGCMPMPIYTAITPNIEPYEWLEFTPFEVGSTYLKAYVPTWAYGRKFKYGRSTNFAPEQSLGYFLGIFSYAFGIDVEDAVRHTSDKIAAFTSDLPHTLKNGIYTLINDLVNSPLDDVRLAPSSLPNFTYKTTTRPLNTDKTLTLIDGGIDFNLPVAPLLRQERNVDIIFCYDASGSIEGCKNLHWLQDYVQAQGLKFPPIDFERADKEIMSIFKDENDPHCPVVVYFPRIKNNDYSTSFDPERCLDGYCATLNFHYDAAQIHELMGLATHAVHQHKDTLHALVAQQITTNERLS